MQINESMQYYSQNYVQPQQYQQRRRVQVAPPVKRYGKPSAAQEADMRGAQAYDNQWRVRRNSNGATHASYQQQYRPREYVNRQMHPQQQYSQGQRFSAPPSQHNRYMQRKDQFAYGQPSQTVFYGAEDLYGASVSYVEGYNNNNSSFSSSSYQHDSTSSAATRRHSVDSDESGASLSSSDSSSLSSSTSLSSPPLTPSAVPEPVAAAAMIQPKVPRFTLLKKTTAEPKDLCVTCLELHARTSLSCRCAHVALCMPCDQKWQSDSMECPVCTLRLSSGRVLTNSSDKAIFAH